MYKRQPAEVPIPPVVRDDDEDQPDVLSDPEPQKRGRGKLVAFPGTRPPQEPEETEAEAAAPPQEEQPDTPSAWVEPKPGDLPPVLIDAALEDEEEEHRPDGFTPGKDVYKRQVKQCQSHQHHHHYGDDQNDHISFLYAYFFHSSLR